MELFDNSSNIHTISYSLLLSFDSNVVENEHVMCVQQRVLEIHNLIQKQEQTQADSEQAPSGDPAANKQLHTMRMANMQHLIDALFQFNNSKLAQSEGVGQEEMEVRQQHQMEIGQIKEESKDLVSKELLARRQKRVE